MSSAELNELYLDLELMIKDYSEVLINELAFRDELEYEKELKVGLPAAAGLERVCVSGERLSDRWKSWDGSVVESNCCQVEIIFNVAPGWQI